MRKAIIVIVVLVLGALSIGRPAKLQPESPLRQQVLHQIFSPPSANTIQTNSNPLSNDPISPVTVNLADIPTNEYDGNSQYDRWLRGEIDLDEREGIRSEFEIANLRAAAMKLAPDERVQRISSGIGLNAPVVGTHFDSLDITECCGSGANVPPDPEMAAGLNHLIAVVNVAFEIYDKSGAVLAGPTTFSSFFSSLGGANCTGGGPFDPNALYDEEADRFIIAVDGNGNSYCVGVSATNDPTGSWHLYEFPTNVAGRFFDYPHAGVGQDAIYMGGNMFAGSSFAEGRVWAFDKAAMYAGLPATSVTRSTGNDDTPQPINLHGYHQGTWPASGPHYILTNRNYNGQTYALHAWNDPFGANTFTTLSVFNLPAVHGVAVGMPINVVQSGGGTIQANDFRPLDFEYRNGRGWTAMTVACNPGGGTVNCIQWAEVDLASATLVQTGIFSSAGDHRFFPDVAANHCGDMAVGYTKSSSTMFPSVWATGRESGDPLGTLQTEIEIKAGEINYTAFDTQPRRWGDYSGMTIDPDGLTFWYLGEYSKITGSTAGRWGNYIASLSFPDCNIAQPTATPTSTATATPTSTSSATPTHTFTPSPTFTATASPTASPTFTATQTFTATVSPTTSQTINPSVTFTATVSPIASQTINPSPTYTATVTQTPLITPTYTKTPLPTSTPSLISTGDPAATAIANPYKYSIYVPVVIKP
jgi:hypothetical protein